MDGIMLVGICFLAMSWYIPYLLDQELKSEYPETNKKINLSGE
jgi:hypothetical protein